MKLSRFTPANKIEIKAPIWNTQEIGIATFRVGHHNEIHILKTDKDGKRLHPLPLYMSGADIKTHPIEPVKSNHNIKLYIVPISELEVLERE